jgi:hypothetical protein
MKLYIAILACLAIIPYRVIWHTPQRPQNDGKAMAERMKKYKPISSFKEKPVVWKEKVKKRKKGLKKKGPRTGPGKINDIRLP